MMNKKPESIRFRIKNATGILNVFLHKFNPTEESVSLFATWLGKEGTMLLLKNLLKRINLDFEKETENEKNGWHYQNSDTVASVKEEMSKLMNRKEDWTGRTTEQ